MGVLQSIFHHKPFLRFAKDNPDRRVVRRMPKLMIDGRLVKIHLPSKLRLKLLHFELKNNVGAKFEVIEKHIKVKFLAFDRHWDLRSNKSKSHPEFEQKFAYMVDEATVKVALMRFFGERQKV